MTSRVCLLTSYASRSRIAGVIDRLRRTDFLDMLRILKSREEYNFIIPDRIHTGLENYSSAPVKLRACCNNPVAMWSKVGRVTERHS